MEELNEDQDLENEDIEGQEDFDDEDIDETPDDEDLDKSQTDEDDSEADEWPQGDEMILLGAKLIDFSTLKSLREKSEDFLRALARKVGAKDDGDHEQLAKRLWSRRRGQNPKKKKQHTNAGTLCPRCENMLRVTFTGPEYRRYMCDHCGKNLKISRND